MRRERSGILASLQVHVLSGRELMAKDFNGLSDPYVEMEVRQRTESRAIEWRPVSRAIGPWTNPCSGAKCVLGCTLMCRLSSACVLLQMQLGEQRKKSSVKWKTLNPVWNERFDFMVEDARHDMLIVSVFDHDMLGMRVRERGLPL